MTFAWKSAGISYLKYSQICAQAVRSSLKKELKAAAAARDVQGIKVSKWENGKPSEYQFIQPQKAQE